MTKGLTPVAEVVAAVERAIHPTPAAEIPIRRCWRAVLAEDVHALISLPPHDNSAMDGYAVRSEDTVEARPDAPVELKIVGRSHAGAPPTVPCAPGDAIEIATGAVVPAGADAVVRIEEVETGEDTILVTVPVEPGRDIRRKGEDTTRDARVLEQGAVLGVVQLAAAAACGHRSLPVHRPARLTLVLTGDEIGGGGALDHGQVPDALGPALGAAIAAEGVDVDVTGPIRDDEARLEAVLSTAASVSDLVVTVGGASVGPRDRVMEVIDGLGGIDRYAVAVKPGKPFGLGHVDETPVMCLPGNPLAALACHELFLRPALGQLAGRPYRPAPRRARLESTVQGAGDRLHLVRGHVSEGVDGAVTSPVDAVGAGRIATAGQANAWLIVPPDTGDLGPGDHVDYRLMAGW